MIVLFVNAKQNKEKAKTEAETKLIKAQGDAKANAVKTKALTDKVLLEQWISKWNGILPLVSGSEGNMIDISVQTNDSAFCE